ncbi:DUF3320 domain-containing protein [Mucilaginibacter corticis]|uniref:DUF3320 domain-containing protein n=1 Tax=Mucilaginibacter corticis TaxID=2597670 RepID=A0A556MM73_9SPHI|nr:DUF3320 domain-containing protein [Mucilaginibacter corticis]TSJ41010.1 DUF3320 domain-containing protein [Mucilaginibacter corticis]
MNDLVKGRLEASRKELLDLGMRNPLLNYRTPKARGLHIVNERSVQTYDILVRQQKAMTFLPAGNTETLPDTKLQTEEEEAKLQTRLLNTYYFARTSIEEQGVNILYLALGMLHWNDGEEERLAPVLLIPVALERSSAQERFRLKYTGAEIGANLSLQAKLKTDFNVALPDVPEADEFDVPTYFKKVKEQSLQNWTLDEDAIELGFFSFGKFLIYNDLGAIAANENIVSLFETGFHEDITEEEQEDRDLDEETNANELFRVVDADSSQLLAMLAVNEGGNIVIQGPPGTGKSQTITNIIANAVGQGKKVLFVAEKMAALDVVKRRLDALQLGETCLELHSHKANKRELHQDLKRTLELGRPASVQLEQENELLSAYRNELNGYCDAANEPLAGSGLSVEQVIGYLLGLGNVAKKLVIDQLDSWDAARFRLAEEFADRVEARLGTTGMPADLPFWGSELALLQPHDKGPLLEQIKAAAKASAEADQLWEEIRTKTGLQSKAQLESAAEAPDLSGLAVADGNWQLKAADIRELIQNGQQLDTLKKQYGTTFIAEAWSQDILEIRKNIVAGGNSLFNFLSGGYRQAKKDLAALLRVPMPKSAEEQLRLVDVISEVRGLETQMAKNLSFMGPLFGQVRDWDKLSAASAYLSTLTDQNVRDYLEQRTGASAAAFIKQLAAKETSYETLKTAALHALKIATEPEWQLWTEQFDTLQKVIDWNQLKIQAHEAGMDFLVRTAEDWPEAPRQLKAALQKTWYEHLSNLAFRLRPELSRFERASHEEIIGKFRRLDQLNLYYNRARVALKHWEDIPKGNAGGQLNILRTEFNKKARHMPIRKLVGEAGKAMQAIKPVWMMSPLSIASFLPPGVLEFDLVIFDEASQVRPVDALGAIARGKQLVVVGDTKQLPPTSFFDKLNADVEDEENVTADLQSILGMCDGQGAPSRMLKWHYRSRHESLISLSNHEFYEDKLVIFPSPGSKESMGLKFHYLPDAIYDRGKTRSNPLEAKAVARAVFEHAKRSPELTLGVVAFSSTQAQAIQLALEAERKQHPETEGFFAAHPNEPFFVKNLENVQGDERDVIMISIGYGRTEDGKVPMNFGPLNNDGGERRLNVLITRAKMRCEVFTNITADDLKTTEATRFGIRALKNFLYFAQFAKLNDPENLAAENRPFEAEVAAQLTKAGYIVRDKVGTPGFYLDLAIVDPDNPGRYLLGIVCDGRAYASARSATDRDRLRGQVLELFGWNIYRVWSTDWYRNPEQELQRLTAAIEQAPVPEPEPEPYEFARVEHPDGQTDTAYQAAILTIDEPKDLQLYTFEQLAGWISEVVQTESPVHLDEVIRRITEASDISRAGARVKYTMTQAARYAEQNNLVKLKQEFLWLPGMETPPVRDRSKLPAASRKIALVAPEEIYEAIRQVVEGSVAITEEDTIPLAAKRLGFARLTEELKQVLSDAVGQCIRRDILTHEGLLLKSAADA